MLRTQFLDEFALRSLAQQVQLPALVKRLRVTPVENSPSRSKGAVAAFVGIVRVADRLVTIHVGLNEQFPLSLPSIHILEPHNLGMLPHVSRDGMVCYSQSAGVLLDRHNPVGIIEEALQKALDELERGLADTNQHDFVDEFEFYWSQLADVRMIESFVIPTDEPREVSAAKTGGYPGKYLFVSDNFEVVRAYHNAQKIQQHTSVTALYIPLQEGILIIPPPAGTFWSLSEFQELIRQNVSPRNLRRLQKLTRKCKQEEVIILGVPRPQGDAILIGVQCIGVEKAHPLIPGGTVKRIMPLLLERKDRTYLMPRSGANTDLSQKKVAIIGCGSVGGVIALELVRLGVLNLTLVDPETLSADNMFRHVLGKEGVGKKKVVLLKDDIRRKFPYVQITTLPEFAEDALTNGSFHPHLFDLIVVAVGDMTVNLHLNHVFYNNADIPPVLYTWLEAHGIGGHALLTLHETRKGCFECLVTPMAHDDEVVDRSSFAASGQDFTTSLSGCATAFTPFGSLDALRTAALAVELAGDVLLGRVAGNSLRSWKGNSREFIHAGYQVSDRYSLSMEELLDQYGAYYNPRCRVCGPGA